MKIFMYEKMEILKSFINKNYFYNNIYIYNKNSYSYKKLN